MPQINIGSSNITAFGYSVTFDILNRSILFNLLPFTTGSGLANTKVAFSVTDSAGVVLASIDFTNPQIPNPAATPTWTLDLSDSPYAFLFSAFSIVASIQDQNGQVYTIAPLIKTVCMPNCFQEDGSVPGMFQIITDCSTNNITVKELTLQIYSSLKPITVTKSGTLSYPTGTISAITFTNTPFTNNQVYSGQYRIACTTYATYDLSNDFYVIVGYVADQFFNITCTSKMSDLLCCIREVQETALKNCDNAKGERANQQLQDITIPFVTGMLSEIRGMDACKEYDLIKKTLSCNCGNSAIGQNEVDPVNPAVNTIVLSGVGGTNVAPPVITGNTKTFQIQSNSYQVTKGNPSDPGFTIGLDTSVPNVTKYPITLNYLALAQQIYTTTAADPTTLAQLNALISAFGINLTSLNGQCIIDLTKVTYTAALPVTGSTGVANIVIGGNTYNAPGGLLANDVTDFATWLNSLSLGAWAVTINAGTVTIVSVDNTNKVSTISFSSPNITLQFGATTKTLVQILQAIISYLCGMTALQIAVGNALSICTFDYNGNIVTTPYDGNTLQSDYNSAVSTALCNLANRISTLTGITCTAIQSIFQDNPNATFNITSDRFLAFVAGTCTALNAVQMANAMIAAINANQTVKNAFCAIDCTIPGTCPIISNSNIGLLSNTSIGLYGVTFPTIPTSSQTITVMYRVTGTSPWNTATGALTILPNGNISGSSPFIIPGLTPGTQYDVSVQNNCGGTALIKQITTPSNTLYTDQFLLDNSLYAICGDAPVTLYSSVPFANGVQMFTDNGLTTPVTGFSYIVQISSGWIYLLGPTGIVGVNSQSNCGGGTLGSYVLGNSLGSICANASQSLYTNGAFAPGQVLFQDSALTTPQTGFIYVVQLSTNTIFNLNSSTGQIGASTGTMCSTTTVRMTSDMAGCSLTNVTGITGFTPSPAFPLNPGGTITGTHSGFTGSIACTITGTPILGGSNITLTVNGILRQTLTVSAAGTFTFGSLTYTSTDVLEIDLNS